MAFKPYMRNGRWIDGTAGSRSGSSKTTAKDAADVTKVLDANRKAKVQPAPPGIVKPGPVDRPDRLLLGS